MSALAGALPTSVVAVSSADAMSAAAVGGAASPWSQEMSGAKEATTKPSVRTCTTWKISTVAEATCTRR